MKTGLRIMTQGVGNKNVQVPHYEGCRIIIEMSTEDDKSYSESRQAIKTRSISYTSHNKSFKATSIICMQSKSQILIKFKICNLQILQFSNS